MNAQLNPLQQQAQTLSESVTAPIPGSRKIHVEGSRPDLCVPMREIALSPTPKLFGEDINHPFCVYDTSGPYTDSGIAIDLLKGLAPVRTAWIAERGDSEVLGGLSSEFGRSRERDAALDGSALADRCLRDLHIDACQNSNYGSNILVRSFVLGQSAQTPTQERRR